MNTEIQDDNDYSIGNDPALTAQVRQELIDSLVAGSRMGAAEVGEEFDRRDLGQAFERALAPLGLSRTQLADVQAAHLMVMWRIVHDTGFPDAEVALAVRDQLARGLRGRPEAVDPAKRQLIGEALLYEAMLSLEAYTEAKADNNKGSLAQMAETTQRNMLHRQAVNLKKTRLNKHGVQRV